MTLLVAYARERLTPGRLLPAGLLVLVSGAIGRGWSGLEALAADTAAAFGLVVSFRVWDDLMDRERDRVAHPDRVLVRAGSTSPLWTAAAVMAAGAAAVLWATRGVSSVMFLAAYTLVLASAYAAAGPRTAARDRILLLKYAVFTLALIGLPAAATTRGLLSAAAAFVAACIYEHLHDADSPVFSFGGSR